MEEATRVQSRITRTILNSQNYFAAAEGRHSLNFGTRLRAYRDANYTSAGSNSSYTFETVADYLAGMPQQYKVTVINKYTARATLFDAALFYQDDWKVKPNFTFSYGLRWESQNRIDDKDDWAPRLSLAYALGSNSQRKPKDSAARWVRLVLPAVYRAQQLFDRHRGRRTSSRRYTTTLFPWARQRFRISKALPSTILTSITRISR